MKIKIPLCRDFLLLSERLEIRSARWQRRINGVIAAELRSSSNVKQDGYNRKCKFFN